MQNQTYIAIASQSGLERKMQAVANNLANMGTIGYKAEKVLFKEHLNRQTGQVSWQEMSSVEEAGLSTDMASGDLSFTGGTFDVGLGENGFFVVETPLGPRYTRAGNFQLNDQGQLVTLQGYPVSGDGGPITVGPEHRNVSIANDGTIASENGIIGKLQVVDFDAPERLQKIGHSLFRANEQAPIAATNPTVKQGYLEQSNVVPVIELNTMIQVQREFEAMQKMLQTDHRRQLDSMDRIFGVGS